MMFKTLRSTLFAGRSSRFSPTSFVARCGFRSLARPTHMQCCFSSSSLPDEAHVPTTAPKVPTKQRGLDSPPPLQKFSCISFYHFTPLSDEEVDSLVAQGPLLLAPYPNIKGTLLVAKEGINGQFCVPTEELSAFHAVLTDLSAKVFKTLRFNIGQELLTHIHDEAFPFKKLRFKVKREVLTDKIEVLDWNDAGPELTPEDWHNEVKSIEETKPDALPPLLFDCRNDYESNIGTFANAIPLHTTSFSQTWDTLSEMLKNEPADRRILTFCTGGIRCVKVNAFLKQKLGFENIGRLENGIIAYDKWLENKAKQENNPEQESVFVGKNFLFDRRRLKEDGHL